MSDSVKSKLDYSLTTGKDDPLFVRSGRINNPIIVKDIRIFRRNLRTKTGWYKRILWTTAFAAPVLIPFLLALHPIESWRIERFLDQIFIATFKVPVLYSFFDNLIESASKYFSYDKSAVFFAVLFLELIAIWSFTLPLHFGFYGYDSPDTAFANLRIAWLDAKAIFRAKAVLSLPIMILILSILFYLYYDITYRCFGGHRLGNHKTILFIQFENMRFLLGCLISAVYFSSTASFLATVGRRASFQVVATLIWCCLLFYTAEFVYPGFVSVNGITSDNPAHIFFVSLVPGSIPKEAEAIPYYCHVCHTYIGAVGRNKAIATFPQSILYRYTRITLLSILQLGWSALALYGIYWNVKRRMNDWEFDVKITKGKRKKIDKLKTVG